MNEGQEKRARPSAWIVRYGQVVSSRRTKREAEAFAEWLRKNGYTVTVTPFVSRVSELDRAWQDAWMADCARELNLLRFREKSALGMRRALLRSPEWVKGEGLKAFEALTRIADRMERRGYRMIDYVRTVEGFAGRAVL